MHPLAQPIKISIIKLAKSKRRIVAEKISGRVTAKERSQFSRLLDSLEPDEALIITKLDRLGCHARPARSTMDRLAVNDRRVHCLTPEGLPDQCCWQDDDGNP